MAETLGDLASLWRPPPHFLELDLARVQDRLFLRGHCRRTSRPRAIFKSRSVGPSASILETLIRDEFRELELEDAPTPLRELADFARESLSV